MKWLRWIPWILASVLLALGAWAVTEGPRSGLGLHTDANIPNDITVNLAGDVSGDTTASVVDDVQTATANLESADNNTTQVATTSFVQQEINGAGGTDLTCSSGSCSVDNRFVRNYEADTMAGTLSVDGLIFAVGDTIVWGGDQLSSDGGRLVWNDDMKLSESNPTLQLDDSSCAGIETSINGEAKTCDNGSFWINIESGLAGELKAPLLIETTEVTSTTGDTLIKIGDCDGGSLSVMTCTNFIQITEGGVLTGEGTATIEADALTGTIPTGVLAVTQSVDTDNTTIATTEFVQDETVVAVDVTGTLGTGFTLTAAHSTRVCDFNVESPLTSDTGLFQCHFPNAATLVEVYCSVSTGTTNIQIYERTETSPDTGTTNMLNDNLLCDTGGEATISFADSGMAADRLLALGIITPFTTGMLRVHVEYTVN